MMEIEALPVDSTSSQHGEGALWDVRTQRLLWVDIDGCKVNVFDPVTGLNTSVSTGTACGTVVPTRRPEVVAVALKDGFATVNQQNGAIEYLQRMNLGDARFNDGKADPAGRFWAGTMVARTARETGMLYRLDADRSLHEMLGGVSTSNGIVWSSDRKIMYYIDTPTARVDAFDYDDATGNITHRRAALKIAPDLGHPDGMTIDSQDRLWIAMWGGGRVCCFDPASEQLLYTVYTTGSRHSSACALGGPNLDELFITTSRQGIKPEEYAPGGTEPHAGKVFRVKVPAKGLPAFEYAG